MGQFPAHPPRDRSAAERRRTVATAEGRGPSRASLPGNRSSASAYVLCYHCEDKPPGDGRISPISREDLMPTCRLLFAPDGSSGGGGSGGGSANVRGIVALAERRDTPNRAAGRIYRQEACIVYTEGYPGANGHQITWLRSYYQGRQSGYRWLVPTPPCRYRPGGDALFARLERRLGLSTEAARSEQLENLTYLGSKESVLSWCAASLLSG
jgi:hypothetical protein